MEEAHIVVDVDLAHLSESMSLKLDKLAGKPNEKEIDDFTIFPVPYKFRQSKKNLFDPSVISIGPLHHGKESLKAMEDQKWQCLRDFLFRGDHISLDLCLSEIKKLEEKTRRCYRESVPLDSNSLVQMMLLDGCFVLEQFLKGYERRLISIRHSVFILPDLLLLENQIPFFIVEKLFEIGLKPDARSRRDFRNYLVNVLARAVVDLSIYPNPTDEIHHFVHLFYHCSIPNGSNHQNEPVAFSAAPFRPSILTIIKYSLLEFFLWVLTITRIFPKRNSPSSSFPNSARKTLMAIPCATELQNAGIKLRPKSNPCHMLDISFDHRVLEIPTLIITNESKTILANIIAFEQYKSDKTSPKLSSFALFLDSLVNTPEDVMILQQCGIINNCLNSDEELHYKRLALFARVKSDFSRRSTVINVLFLFARKYRYKCAFSLAKSAYFVVVLIDFFNQICKGMVVDNNHFLAELFAKVNNYCKSSWSKRLERWNRHKKQFIKDYFSSPWTAISLVAGVFVVLLTFVQAFFAVYAYYVPPS